MNDRQKKDYLVKLGKHIKQLRESRGLSYRELASRCALEHARIYEIEAGNANIKIFTLLELAAGLEVEPSEILNFE